MATSDQAADAKKAPARRLRRAERREQILRAATRAFARSGFVGTGLDDVATEAGVTRVILYRHFESKSEMYRAVLDRACARLADSVGSDNFDADTVPALVRAAADDPDGFRLVFRYAATEPDFRDVVDALSATSIEVAERNLAGLMPAGPWRTWAARLLPVVTIEAVIAWLDSGQPDPDGAAERVNGAVRGVLDAALGRPRQ